MDYLEHRKASPRSLVFALVTVSDSRTVETDESGRIAEDILKSSGHEVCKRIIVPNDEGEIRRIIEELLSNGGIDVILTIGGTGLSRRDVTVETVSKTVEKRIEGFGELFRFLSYSEIGTAAMLTRAFAGVVKGKILICLPGSKNAVELAIRRLILPEIGHMVREARR
ncbi:MAG: molybdenum cofactor biosynthesis protein MoaB [Candidatus Brockarchaeota archaeon]|nr:molybdenum cofactor biosynthesis protein MoaB [Candidatus Brockarchaeota archaeon]